MSLLTAGRVGRPHGLDGSFHVTRPRGMLLWIGGSVRISDAVHEIVRRAGTEDRPILRLQGIDDRAGSRCCVARSCSSSGRRRRRCPRASTGRRISSVAPWRRRMVVELGVVDAMRALPSCEVLEVGELLVPMVGDAVLSIDLATRRIVVDPEFLGVEQDG